MQIPIRTLQVIEPTAMMAPVVASDARRPAMEVSMVFSRFTKLSATAVATLLMTSMPGCADRETTSSGTESETGSASETSGTTGTSGETTAGPTDTDTSTSSTTEEPTTSTGQDFLTTGPDSTSTGPDGPLPNGAQCMADSECESGNCYIIPMVLGVCSECNEDSDCPPEKASCSLDVLSMQAQCVVPEPGAQCESDATCMAGGEELYCEGVIPGLELFLPNTCGECRDDNDCENGQLCNSNIDIMSFGGYKACVDPGSVDNDGFCSSNEVCSSGHCNETAFEGLPIPISFEICGECSTDEDCMGGTCVPGSVSMGGAMGSTCQ